MPKLEAEITAAIVKRRVKSPEEQREVLADIKHVLEQEALEKETKPKKPKKEFVMLVSDPKGVLDAAYPEGITGWVLQVTDPDTTDCALWRVIQSAYDFNASPKGRKFPVQTIGEACESVPTKITKEHKVWIKTKTPVLVLRTDNKLPKAPISQID